MPQKCHWSKWFFIKYSILSFIVSWWKYDPIFFDDLRESYSCSLDFPQILSRMIQNSEKKNVYAYFIPDWRYIIGRDVSRTKWKYFMRTRWKAILRQIITPFLRYSAISVMFKKISNDWHDWHVSKKKVHHLKLISDWNNKISFIYIYECNDDANTPLSALLTTILLFLFIT